MNTATRRRKSPEAELQKSIMAFVFAKQGQHPALQLLFHCPNGGKRTPVEAAEFEKMGVRPGVSDLCLPVRSYDHQYIGLWIELKSGKQNQTQAQFEWLHNMALFGHRAVICRSLLDALTEIQNHLGADWSYELNQLKTKPGTEIVRKTS